MSTPFSNMTEFDFDFEHKFEGYNCTRINLGIGMQLYGQSERTTLYLHTILRLNRRYSSWIERMHIYIITLEKSTQRTGRLLKNKFCGH
jgi:hypothetical protein